MIYILFLHNCVFGILLKQSNHNPLLLVQHIVNCIVIRAWEDNLK